jgi:hypothetical protein
MTFGIFAEKKALAGRVAELEASAARVGEMFKAAGLDLEAMMASGEETALATAFKAAVEQARTEATAQAAQEMQAIQAEAETLGKTLDSVMHSLSEAGVKVEASEPDKAAAVRLAIEANASRAAVETLAKAGAPEPLPVAEESAAAAPATRKELMAAVSAERDPVRKWKLFEAYKAATN